MQRIINNPDDIVDDAVNGYVKAFPNLLKRAENPRVLAYSGTYKSPKVGVITGGGSGHEPAFLGYVGKNMLDAVAIGEIFSSPTAISFLDAAKAADQGKGVACLYGNYAGDNMNVRMATSMALSQGLTIRSVVANDDVASSPKTELAKRRGVAGEILMWKVGCAASTLDYDLEGVIRVAQKAIDSTRSVGVGLSSCTIPAVGKPNFHIEEGTMEVGIGHHGEPGISVSSLGTSNELAQKMTNIILPDLPFVEGDEVVVLLSGLGATPVMELQILYSDIFDILIDNGIKIHTSFVGNYFTSLEMQGATLTLMKLDEELKKLVDLPASSIGFNKN